jgi:putative nucleotidyltransferase with HDIG domain
MKPDISRQPAWLASIVSLPAPSPVLKRIDTVVRDPESCAADIVNSLKLDPSTAGRVLKLANSAYIGIPRTVSSLQNAVVLLGTKRIHSLVLASGLLDSFPILSSAPFTVYDYWRHSITVALIAESVAKHLRRYDSIDEEEVFAAAVLHDIGKLVIAGFDPNALGALYARGLAEGKPLHALEEDASSHVHIGELLAAQWNFPVALTDTIGRHHAPFQKQENRRLVSIVHMADFMAHMLGYGTIWNEAPPRFEAVTLDEMRLLPETLKIIASKALEDQKKIEEMVAVLKSG